LSSYGLLVASEIAASQMREICWGKNN